MLVPIVVADVMATVFIYVRLMLLPIIVADVNTTLLPLIVILADVIAMICRCHVTTILMYVWLMLLPSGRWNSHCKVGVVADVIAMWQME